jgi:N-acetylglucosamine-6-sulfatase
MATALALLAFAFAVPSMHIQAQTSPPNVVLIVMDDMRADEMVYMPTLQSELIGKGRLFTNGFVSNSLCCPSRAAILSGRYSHTTKVWNNMSSTGGWTGFRDDESATIATALNARGYHTGLVGKYFNGYKKVTFKPAGWDSWTAFKSSTIGYYNYTLTNGATTRSFGSTASDYSTDVLSTAAESFVMSAPPADPLFLYFAPYAPHSPFTPAPRHKGALSAATVTLPPNVGEVDMSDKPAFFRNLPRRTSWSGKRKQMEMLLSVDEGIARILDALARSGRLENTIILFTADNGLSGYSHNFEGKKNPYEESGNVPMVWRWDAAGWTGTEDRLAANVDIAPTIMAATGGTLSTEGRSLLPLLAGEPGPWIEELVLERLGDEADEPGSYCGVRTGSHKFIHWGTGEEELYDLVADPYEMRSLHDDPSYEAIEMFLRDRARTLCVPLVPGMAPF